MTHKELFRTAFNTLNILKLGYSIVECLGNYWNTWNDYMDKINGMIWIGAS